MKYESADHRLLGNGQFTDIERKLMTKSLEPIVTVMPSDADQYSSKSINKLPANPGAARDLTRPVKLTLMRLYDSNEYHPLFKDFDIRPNWSGLLHTTCTYLLVDQEALAELLDPSISGPYYTRQQVHDNMSRAISGRLDRIDSSRFNQLFGFRYDHDTVVAAMFIYDISALPKAIPIKPGKEEVTSQ
jgi:hypothetical protein